MSNGTDPVLLEDEEDGTPVDSTGTLVLSAGLVALGIFVLILVLGIILSAL